MLLSLLALEMVLAPMVLGPEVECVTVGINLLEWETAGADVGPETVAWVGKMKTAPVAVIASGAAVVVVLCWMLKVVRRRVPLSPQPIRLTAVIAKAQLVKNLIRRV